MAKWETFPSTSKLKRRKLPCTVGNMSVHIKTGTKKFAMHSGKHFVHIKIATNNFAMHRGKHVCPHQNCNEEICHAQWETFLSTSKLQRRNLPCTVGNIFVHIKIACHAQWETFLSTSKLQRRTLPCTVGNSFCFLHMNTESQTALHRGSAD